MALTPAAARAWTLATAAGAATCLLLLLLVDPWFLLPTLLLAGLAMWLSTQARAARPRPRQPPEESP